MIKQCVVPVLPWGGMDSKSQWCHWLTVDAGAMTCKGEPVAIPSIVYCICWITLFSSVVLTVRAAMLISSLGYKFRIRVWRALNRVVALLPSLIVFFFFYWYSEFLTRTLQFTVMTIFWELPKCRASIKLVCVYLFFGLPLSTIVLRSDHCRILCFRSLLLLHHVGVTKLLDCLIV